MPTRREDLWAVYDASEDLVVDALVELMVPHPVFGKLLGPDPRATLTLTTKLVRDGREQELLRIMPRGIPLRAWHEVAVLLRRQLIPRLVALYDGDRLTGALFFLEDLIERLIHALTDWELLTRETRFRLLFDNHPLPTWVFDIETLYFLEVNDAAVRVYGWSREELLAMRITEIRPEEDVAQLMKDLERPPTYAVHVARHRTRDGSIIWVEASGHSFVLEGRPARLVVVTDVTERRAAEERARRADDQVRQLQKMEAVGLLAGGIAHDFNNVLTVIQSYAEFALDALPEGHPARADVQELRRAAQQAAALTGRLLTFSRRKVIDPQPIDLNRAIVDMDRMLRRVIGEDIEMRTVAGAQHARIRADRGQLEQVLLNLVVNARDAMREGGSLLIETSDAQTWDGDAPPPGKLVMLAVSDTGHGMDSATTSRVFEPFFTTKPPGKGTGLGLTTVYGIVQQTGGQIHVYSEPGRGTTFKLYFPIDETPELAVAPPVVRHDGHRDAVILLVEDDDRVRAAVRRTLDQGGFTVLEARDGLEAQTIADEHGGTIDLMLTDMVMPGASGPDAAAAIRWKRPELKVLFMSGYTDRAVIQNGMLDGAAQFIEKPFTPDAILAKIRSLL